MPFPLKAFEIAIAAADAGLRQNTAKKQGKQREKEFRQQRQKERIEGAALTSQSLINLAMAIAQMTRGGRF